MAGPRREVRLADARSSAQPTPTTCSPNTKDLDQRIGDLDFTVDQIANGSRGLMEEVATGKVTGEEEYWSRTDLWDFQANVDGAQQGASRCSSRCSSATTPSSRRRSTQRFDALQELLDAQRDGRRVPLLRRAAPRSRSSSSPTP